MRPDFDGSTDPKISAVFEAGAVTKGVDAVTSSKEDVSTASFVVFGGGFFVARSSSWEKAVLQKV